MNKHVWFVISVSLLVLTGCWFEYSPYEIDVSTSNLTNRMIYRIAGNDEGDVPFKVAFLSDIHFFYDKTDLLVKRLNSRDDIDFVCVLGDLAHNGLLKEYETTLKILKKLDVPFLTVIGNHDSIANGKEIYRDMFGSYNYTMLHKGVRFVFLNTNTWEFGSGVPNFEWLESVASAPGPRYSVLLCHVNGSYDNDGKFSDVEVETYNRIMRAYFVLNINGHAHERSNYYLIDGIPRYDIGSVGYGYYMIVTFHDACFEVEQCRM
jgi:3',5'-cyclic-AMP phosphodiesterase